MIYVHSIAEIHDVNTDILVKTEEKLLKFENEEKLNEYSFNVVKRLGEKNLSYPGNGRIYVDFSTRTLTDAEVKFLGIPA